MIIRFIDELGLHKNRNLSLISRKHLKLGSLTAELIIGGWDIYDLHKKIRSQKCRSYAFGSALNCADHVRGCLTFKWKKTSSSPKNQLTVFKLSGYHSTSNKQRKSIPSKWNIIKCLSNIWKNRTEIYLNFRLSKVIFSN